MAPGSTSSQGRSAENKCVKFTSRDEVNPAPSGPRASMLLAEDCTAVCDLDHTPSASLAEIISIFSLPSQWWNYSSQTALQWDLWAFQCQLSKSPPPLQAGHFHFASRAIGAGRCVLIPEEAAPQFLDDAAPRNGMKPPPDSEMIAPPITE